MFRTLSSINDVDIITSGNCIWGRFEKPRFGTSSLHVVNAKKISSVEIRSPATVSRTYLINLLYTCFPRINLLVPSSVNWDGSN